MAMLINERTLGGCTMNPYAAGGIGIVGGGGLLAFLSNLHFHLVILPLFLT
jgi:hypothetical protein